MAWMIIRVRGTIHARRDIAETMARLHLTRPNYATVVPEAPVYRGMITKVQGYVTWGEAEAETLGLLVKARGRAPPGPAPTEGATPAAPVAVDEILAKGLTASTSLRPVFRLHPPHGGWRSTKKPFASGGALGYRGRAINELARKML